jgi:hypothetical protein
MHITAKVNKANSIIGVIRVAFEYLDLKTFRMLYVSLVRPHLEYTNPVWNPYLKKHIDMIENDLLYDNDGNFRRRKRSSYDKSESPGISFVALLCIFSIMSMCFLRYGFQTGFVYLLKFHPDKCKTMRIGCSKVEKHEYTLKADLKPMEETIAEKDVHSRNSS